MTSVYVKGGVEIPGDSWVTWTNASGQEVQTQPINMTTGQMSRAGVTTVPLDPMPDPFYGPVVKDPANPGKWIQTPYTADEMKPLLESYSTGQRFSYETGNIIIHPAAGGDYGASTMRDDASMYHKGLTYLKDGDGVGGTVTAKMMRVKTTNPPAYGSVLYVISNLAKITEIVNAVSKWTDLCFAQEHSLYDQIEAGTITTKDQINSAYLSMRTGAFPIIP